jgi:type IV secretory pathway VirB2 component (pilin)
MNPVTLFFTTALLHLPRLSDDAGNLCIGAGDCSASSGGGAVDNATGSAPSSTSLSSGLTGHIQTITDTLLLVAGAVAVIIIIVAGIRYITSTGDSARIKQSKDTLLYAIAGLVVVLLAYAIVHFVANNV